MAARRIGESLLDPVAAVAQLDAAAASYWRKRVAEELRQTDEHEGRTIMVLINHTGRPR